MEVGTFDPTPLQKGFPKSTTQYFDKELPQLIVTLEDEYVATTPRMVAKKIFPPSWHFQPKDFQKTQKYYKFILIDIDSIAIKHYRNKNNEITHSSAQILQVLTPTS